MGKSGLIPPLKDLTPWKEMRDVDRRPAMRDHYCNACYQLYRKKPPQY